MLKEQDDEHLLVLETDGVLMTDPKFRSGCLFWHTRTVAHRCFEIERQSQAVSVILKHGTHAYAIDNVCSLM